MKDPVTQRSDEATNHSDVATTPKLGLQSHLILFPAIEWAQVASCYQLDRGLE